ncbi:uncharacterized protein ACA1_254260 [Acanthamoeba castellanii str. Neff]|uniref:Uncharacterized protein n=1 Tax=Acanthamoeba castellanii (strain ATCC 30010 / Neff) TaxID=1257118 RepID=L8HA28_ACACF|nr:uncharacterized protein ACA1_254260 [Acanthamoeba castellanii str. Neff]ELR22389.1 hypothetical protein ACA1_254260 [Acanthamoeba castellanii str. Neff]
MKFNPWVLTGEAFKQVPATPPPIPTKSKKTPAEKAEALKKKKVAKKATSAQAERFASALQTTVSQIQHHLELKKQPFTNKASNFEYPPKGYMTWAMHFLAQGVDDNTLQS